MINEDVLKRNRGETTQDGIFAIQSQGGTKMLQGKMRKLRTSSIAEYSKRIRVLTGTKVRILCVDDDLYILNAYQRFFRKANVEVLTATSTEEAIKLLKQTQVIQVVVSDYEIPGMNGVDFLCLAKEIKPSSIGVLTARNRDNPVILEAMEKNQIFRCIAMPWSRSNLKKVLIDAFALSLSRFH